MTDEQPRWCLRHEIRWFFLTGVQERCPMCAKGAVQIVSVQRPGPEAD